MYAYNGWPASPNPADFGGLEQVVVAGESFAPGVRAGDVATVFRYLAEQLHARVEPIVRADWHQADDWGYFFKKSANSATLISCHAAGCAIDYNATRHPNGKTGTWTAAQAAEIRKILAELDGVVHWGGDGWGPGSVIDSMHFEIKGSPAQVAAVAARLRGAPAPAPVPAPAPAPAGRPTLRRGSTGAAVKDVQRRLRTNYPLYAKHLVVDGDFGPKTDAAVREFQRRSRLVVDGVVGPKTWRALGL